MTSMTQPQVDLAVRLKHSLWSDKRGITLEATPEDWQARNTATNIHGEPFALIDADSFVLSAEPITNFGPSFREYRAKGEFTFEGHQVRAFQGAQARKGDERKDIIIVQFDGFTATLEGSI